jgi:hypothetical protein
MDLGFEILEEMVMARALLFDVWGENVVAVSGY